MKLNHYTSFTLARSILIRGFKIGNYWTEMGGRLDRTVIWLTNSSDATGHGIPDGSDFSEAQINKLIALGEKPKNNTSHNKRAIKISIDTTKLKRFNKKKPHAGGLISFVEFSELLGESAEFRKSMGARGIFPELSDISRKEVIKKAEGLRTKEKTWYVHVGEIPAKCIASVEGLAHGTYTSFNYEIHGRPELLKSGIHPTPAELDGELSQLWGKLPAPDIPLASCFCAGLSDEPCVSFDYNGNRWEIFLESLKIKKLYSGVLPSNLQDYSDFVSRHKEVFLNLWEDAVGSYHRYYPDQQQ